MQKTNWRRYGWAALGGLALAASFPKVGVAGLAWVAPGWLLVGAMGRTSGEVFRIGFVGGLAYGLAAFYWLLLIPFPAGAIAGWLALSAYLALYTATWTWLCCQLRPKTRDVTAPPVDTDPALISALVLSPLHTIQLAQRIGWALICAVLWVALEMLLARLFTGFPWNLLGVSQYQVLPILQVAEYTGVYGISFLLVWFSVSLAQATLELISHPTRSKAWLGDLALPLTALLAVIAFGATRLAERRAEERTLRMVLIQPSIPQTLIWDTNQNAMRFTQLVSLSERALNTVTNAQVLVWPEAAVPNMLRYEWDTYSAVTNLALSHHVWVILGSDDAVPQQGGDPDAYDAYNSSFLVNPEGKIVASYRKRQLVIFGEYIPLQAWLPLMKYLTPVGGSFAVGRHPVPFPFPDLQAKTSVLICFEDIFPHLAREYVEPDTDFLLNLTNNGWFGESAAQWQHAANAVLRTVENRIPLVRCANNGLTCWVDAFGGMRDVYFEGSKDIYQAGFKTVDVPLLHSSEKRQLTFYTRHGDVFGWACVALSVILIGADGLRKLRAGQGTQAIGCL
jgi:apolipoprotein N-acyltransferase